MPLRLIALAVLAATALALAASELGPRQYVARGGVLLPSGMVKVQYEAADPGTATALVQAFIAGHRNALLVDPPRVVPVRTPVLENSGFLLVMALLAAIPLLRRRRQPTLRSENQLIEVLGAQPLAARPLAAHDLARQLLAHWFGPRRAVLAVVSPQDGDGAKHVAAELARACAAGGVSTLLIDADFRAPALHQAFGLRNRAGLADFLEERPVQLTPCAENLSVLVAGRASGDPLELLSRPRMQQLLAAAASRYQVVLVATPAAARGPDLQLPAAFSGGALVVTRKPADASALKNLQHLLERSRARVVGTVLNPA
jgi:Mrp family chromosome partitioning ATPase